MYSKLIQLIEWYDNRYTKPVPCSNDLLCERRGTRHKDGCIGRTVPTSIYIKGIKEVH